MVRKLSLIIAFVLSGCSAHNPFIVSNTTDTKSVSTTKYPPHTNKVYVTENSLPASMKYEILESIEVGKVWYGSSDNVKKSMADRAREIGANAVIEIKTWHQPSGFSWAAPHGSGKAVRMSQPDFETLSKRQDEWF